MTTLDARGRPPPPPPPTSRYEGGVPSRPRPSRHGSSSNSSIATGVSRSHLSVNTSSNAPGTKLYSLPPSLDSPIRSRSGDRDQGRRNRPGGLAAVAASSNHSSYSGDDGGSIMSGAGSSRVHQYGSESVIGGRMATRRGSDFSLLASASNPRSSLKEWNDAQSSRTTTAGHNYHGSYAPDAGRNMPSQESLSLFAHHCRQFYMSTNPPSESSAFISTALSTVPQSHRAVYTRLQGNIRSLAHLHHLRIKLVSFHALMTSTLPSGSMTPGSRFDLNSLGAKRERKDKFRQFINTWYTSSEGTGIGGVEPFFVGLYAVLRVQSRGERERGGAAGKCVVWEVDDAVFMESGGADFMNQAITLLKGILGFTDQPLTPPPQLKKTRGKRTPAPSSITSDPLQSQRSGQAQPPLPPKPVQPSTSSNLIALDSSDSLSMDAASRSRSSSDPFTDNILTNRQSPLVTISQGQQQTLGSHSPGLRYPLPSPRDTEETEVLLPSNRIPSNSSTSNDLSNDTDFDEEEYDEDDLLHEEAELNKPRLRLWQFPKHITDEEILDLLSIFPKSIKNKPRIAKIRFPYASSYVGQSTLSKHYGDGPGEGGGTDPRWTRIDMPDSQGRVMRVPKEDSERELGVVRLGTGRMWVTGVEEERDGGWRGSGWFKFVCWWKRLFGME